MHKATDIYIAITTYDRPEELKALLEDISRETAGKRVHIHIYDDASPEPIFVPYDTTRYQNNHGKKGYWSIMNDVMRDAEVWDFKYFFFLQDDCRLTEGFFDLAVDEYEAIPDVNKATLCTFTPQSIYERTMWSTLKAKDVVTTGRKFINCNYVDCIFMCPRETLALLGFRMQPIPMTRFTNEFISSGVGQQLTLRLMRYKKTMYCAYSSLIKEHSNTSKMNEEERKKNPLLPLVRAQEEPIVLSELLSLKYERVTVGMASIKSRMHTLKTTIDSLLPQVDHIHVYLNDYETVPSFLQNNDKITYYLGKIYKDRGDTGKYFAVNGIDDGYFFSCDDDLIYPSDYVQKTIEFLKSKQNKVIATYHGAILNKGVLQNYYRDRKQIHYAHFQRTPIPVHIGGTGVMAFHVHTFKPTIKNFAYPNMSDIWVGVQAQDAGIPIICAPRPLGWIKAMEIPSEETIHGSKLNHDVQTEVLNTWREAHGEFTIADNTV